LLKRNAKLVGKDNEIQRFVTLPMAMCSHKQLVNEPEGLRELALKPLKWSPSDFRGVDIGYNEKSNELFVIEVNSAPGIQGSNIAKYLEKIVNYV